MASGMPIYAQQNLMSPLTTGSERIVLPLWRSLHSLNLMLPKEDRKAMLLRLYNDDSPLMDHSKDRFNRQPNGDHASSDVELKDELVVGADDEEVAAARVPATEEGAMNMEDDAYSKVEDEAAKEVEVAVGVRDEEDVFNTTV